MASSETTHLRQRAVCLLLSFVLAGKFECVLCDTIEVCASEDLQISCPRDNIIFMTTAEYGRMEVGKCIRKKDEFMGCRNDVIQLLDKWCSGRQECTVRGSNEDLDSANLNCLEMLRPYLKVEYDCIEGLKCNINGHNSEAPAQGFISSSIMDRKGCGSRRSPLIISAKPGQTIHLEMIDFGTSVLTSSFISCSSVYGYILETPLGINHTICSGKERQTSLYTSKTNYIELVLLSREKRSGSNFLIKYKIVGCPELVHPAHAWYKREGDEAVIGCENNNKEWHLVCIENSWHGEIGNCTEIVSISKPDELEEEGMQMSAVVVISGIVGLAIVLSVIAIIIGVVYIKKYRMRQEMKRADLFKTYSTLDRNLQAYYQAASLDQSTNVGICSDMLLVHDPCRPVVPLLDQCTCPKQQMCTIESRNPSNGCSPLETQSLYNSIKST